ncbi:MAG: phosphocholine cytidylyltransferase family protein [Oscillospiraceae bacterium]|nr:phosphocholine cytidylyltransferase family protein [Oscillospiraceae bacterium]
MKYKAILMAAGQGVRISRSVENNCKCTLNIGGVSLIRHTVQMLLDKDIEVHLVIGFNRHLIKQSLKGLNVIYHENMFFSITNSLASLWFARTELSGDAVILGNADVFWEENLLSVLMNETRDCVMLCDSSRVEQGDYLFKVVDGRVVSYGKGMDCRHANCEYVGLALIQGDMVSKCRVRLQQMIEHQRHGEWWEQVLYSMTAERPIWAKDIAGHFWAEIDYIEDYNRILEYRGVKK